MVLPFLSGSRRGRLVGVAILLTVFVFWLSSQTPLSTVRENPFDLHPVTAPKASGERPSHDHAGSHHGFPAQEAEEAEDSTTEEVITDIDNQDEVELAVTTTTTAEATESATATPTPSVECPDFEPDPPSEGKRKFPYARPAPECRKFRLPALEDLIERMKKVIRDPDLFRVFENSYPKTLDIAVKWRGYATKKDETTGEQTETDEELAYIVTGADVDAMWLRDSATQVHSYLPLLEASETKDSLASLWRGLINSHSRYIATSPYCHSFQPPPESGIKPSRNSAPRNNHTTMTTPPFDPQVVFDCKWELDGLASFLQISAAYYRRTGDLDFFGKYSWVDAVQAAVNASAAMSRVQPNDIGSPVKANGMVRSAFRPSDEACTFQLLTPSNMMWAAYLEQASDIMHGLAEGHVNDKAANLTVEMRKMAKGIRRGIALDAVVKHREFGDVFAYEVDGHGGTNLMDDANIPSLLAMPLWNFTLPEGKHMVKSMKHTPRSDAAAAAKTEEEESGDETDETASTTTTAEPSSASSTPPPRPNNTTSSHHNNNNTTRPLASSHHNNNNNTTRPLASSHNTSTPHDYALIYQNTRTFALSPSNPHSPPHLHPLALTVAALTAFSPFSGFSTPEKRDDAIATYLHTILDSMATNTDANADKRATTTTTAAATAAGRVWNAADGTRTWGGWANGLFGELMVRIAEDEEARERLLGRLWQD